MKTIGITGMVRSGSTFVWQVIRNIGGGEVEYPNSAMAITNKFSIYRTCCFFDHTDITFVIYRDFRDVLVSWSKLHNSTIQEIFFLNRAECFQSYLRNLLRYKKEYWNDPNYYFIKYEDYFPNNTKDLVEYIYTSLECVPNENEYDLVCEKFSLEKAKIVADKYDELQKKNRPKTSLPNHDKQTRIHGGHITNNGEAGIWKQYMDNVEIMNIFDSLKYDLEEFGYKLRE